MEPRASNGTKKRIRSVPSLSLDNLGVPAEVVAIKVSSDDRLTKEVACFISTFHLSFTFASSRCDTTATLINFSISRFAFSFSMFGPHSRWLH